MTLTADAGLSDAAFNRFPDDKRACACCMSEAFACSAVICCAAIMLLVIRIQDAVMRKAGCASADPRVFPEYRPSLAAS